MPRKIHRILAYGILVVQLGVLGLVLHVNTLNKYLKNANNEVLFLRSRVYSLTSQYQSLYEDYTVLTSRDGYSIPEQQEWLVFPFFPSDQVYLTSQFSLRPNPLLANTGPNVPIGVHRGIDFVSLKQDAVRATASGTVVEHWPAPDGYWRGNGAYGGFIVIEDSNGYQHAYSHLAETFIRTGQVVDSGEIIGRMGASGMTTGPHLHYEIRRRDEYGELVWFDPMMYFDIRIAEFGQVLFPEDSISTERLVHRSRPNPFGR